jgi:hypothetical protein
MYRMSRNEAFAAFAITLIAVAAYSAWGAYLLETQKSMSPQAVHVEQ